jgi:hypothetical protein
MAHPLPVIPNGFLVTQRITSVPELHDMDNVFCVLCSASTSGPDIADAFADAYAATFDAVRSSAMVLGTTSVLPLDGITPTGTFVTDKTGDTGGHNTGTPMPNACAFGITWQTAHRGKSYRGRSYIPGVSTDQVVDTKTRTLTAGAQTVLQTAAAAFTGSLAAQTPALTLVVLSRKLGLATTVTTGRSNPGVVEQRRRYERVAHR